MVIAIIVIIIAFVAPAVSGFGRTAGLTSAGNTVTNLATLARQTAMTKGTMTALVLLTDQGTEDDYRAVTILEYSRDIGWAQATSWEVLPTGVIVNPNLNGSEAQTSTFLDNSPRPFPLLGVQTNPPVSYKGKAILNSGYAARIFLPNGSLQNSDQSAQLRLVEGHLISPGRVAFTRPGANGLPANFYDIILLGATGVAKVYRP